MMRVCHVMTADLWAGAEVQVATTVSHLVQQGGLQVTAVLFNHGRLEDELRRLGIPVTTIDETTHNAFQIVLRLIEYCRDQQIDLVHTHRYKDAVLGMVAARLAGVPHAIRTMHGLREPMHGWNDWKFRAYEALDKAVLHRCADRVIAVSNRMAATLIRGGYRPSLVTTIHNGIDVNKVSAPRPYQQTRQALDLPAATLVIGTAGRLSAVKGHDTFLRAARLVLDREPGARFVIAGGGPLEDELVALACELGIAHACRFLGARSDVHDVMAAMDVFVLPSLNEGLPMAILEAMALGKAVIASNVGGLPEVIRHRETGLLVPAGDPRALADACLELAQHREWAGQLGAQARVVVESQFSHDRNGTMLSDLYRGVRRPSPRRIGLIELGVGLTTRAVGYATRRIRHAIERYQVTRIRRSPAALVEALRAGQNILVVCHGNIIRSPFAAYLLEQSLGRQPRVSIASAGLEATPGQPPHPRALRQAAERRIDLSAHAASRIERERVAASDVIFVMDIQQLLALRQRFPEARRKTFLLTSLAPETPMEIRDPVNGDESVFHACFDHITRAVRPLAGVLAQSPQRT
jgi:glycosyltransferase involved in cell wall biosynthesis/protein-tyrosine-phosphatase